MYKGEVLTKVYENLKGEVLICNTYSACAHWGYLRNSWQYVNNVLIYDINNDKTLSSDRT